MALALLADLHGNLTALEAVLEDMSRFDIESVLCLGDVANFGPQPQATLRRLRNLEPDIVLGNTDAYLLKPRTLKDVTAPDDNTDFFLAVEAWSAEQLEASDRAYIRTFQKTVRLEVAGLNILAYHGSPKSYDDPVRAGTPDEVLDGFFEGETADLYLGAHTHEQFVRRYHTARVMNPGSVGNSFVIAADGRAFNYPIAEYALLDVLHGEPNLTFRRVTYDAEAYVASIRESGMPFQDRMLEDFKPQP
ncbi:metallophosphoesterase family protein [soil metagenome]